MNRKTEILRATIFHTPANPFREARALVAIADGALLLSDGKIVVCGSYEDIRGTHPDTSVQDLRGGYLLPGFIDTHVHYPQVRILGGFGYSLLDWLRRLTLPEEARLADTSYAAVLAREFVRALATHGTTTALVFGSHFHDATAELFEAAAQSGLRIFSGLVLADRLLRDDLHQTPESAWRDSRSLIHLFHGRGRLGYAVTPRFALSASEPMLEVCRALLGERPGLLFQTHLNENPYEIREVGDLFPWAADYLDVYQRFDLTGRRSVFAHNVHPRTSELERLAASGSSIAHCPCSNAVLGSGIFPLARHVAAGVRVSLGTDVGAGSGFGLLKEALQVYMQQRVAPEPLCVTPVHLLYLATRAGADALDIGHLTGDFSPGKSADLVYIRPPENSVLAGVVRHAEAPEHILAALFSMAGAESIREVRVEGEVVMQSPRCREQEQPDPP